MPYSTGSSGHLAGGSYATVAFRHVVLLHTRFPDVQPVFDELLGESQMFRDLVQEYGECADALDRCSEQGAGAPMLEQYTSLRFALERALLEHIRDHCHSASRG